MQLSEVCKPRTIKPHELGTPMLVPSFSSRAARDVMGIFDDVRNHITEVSLVSAYDMHYARLRREEIYASDLLFIDSGGYECKVELQEDIEAYHSFLEPRPWNHELYSSAVSHVEELSQVILVTYDDNEYVTFEEQLERGHVLKTDYPQFAIDFLVKPESRGEPVSLQLLASHLPQLADFSILGFVEQELGNTLHDRCCTLLQTRLLLSDEGIESPIHVFGSLDPLRSILFFMCGADIFDGLSWLRYKFVNGIGQYKAQNGLLDGDLTTRVEDLERRYRINNLTMFRDLQNEMSSFAESHDFEDLKTIGQHIHTVKSVLRSFGLKP